MNKLWTDLEQYYTLTAQTPQPVETDKRERLETPDSLARRDFLKLGGVAAVFSLVGCMQRPAEKIIPYLNQPEETVPGVATWYASTCGECQAACGVLARVREGRPVKLEGNPNHPLNQGKLCARGQASLYNLYDPGRMRAPVRRKADGGWEEADFDTLDTEIAGKLKAANGEVVLVTGAWHGPARVDLVRKFLAGIPGSSHLRFEVLADQLWLDTLNAAFGTQLPALYAFDRAELVVTFGADPLAGSPYRMKYLREFADRRDPESRPMLKLVSFDPAMSETAALADERHPVRGSQLYKVAGALARQIISVRRASRYALGDRVDAALTEFDSHKVETELGLAPDTIAKLVDQLIAAGSRSLLISENVSNSGPGGRQLHLLVNLLNYALGAVGSTFLLDSVPAAHRTDSPAALARLVKRMADGKVGVVIFCGTNPAHVLPEEAGFAAALARVSLKVSLSDRLDETAALCDYVLPSLHGAECWNDAEPQPGVYSLQQPTISPIWNNRQAEDSLIRLAFLAGNRDFAAGEAPAVWRDYLKNYWKENVYPATGASGSFDSFWVGRLREGVCRASASTATAGLASFNEQSLGEAGAPEPAGEAPELRLTVSSVHLDGRTGNNPWLLELPDPVARITWENYISLAPASAEKMGLAKGSLVKLSVNDKEMTVPVNVQPGVAEGVAALAVGWGRSSVGEIGNGRGVNAFRLATFDGNGLSFTVTGAGIAATGEKVRLAGVMGHDDTAGRPIVFQTTLAEYRENPKAGQFSHGGHEEVEPTMPEYSRQSIWGEDHAYPGHRWGMAVDLNRCNGCGACTLACQAENNIPVVGKQEMLNGREMHWIRIDRYYHGDPANPEVIFQPMLCQHCLNAPCETVCPVIATLHNDEGLNVQVYNRCVGTRYCSNNCPYKVRRFNWFEFALKAYGRKPLQMQLNPDVTVREKGVMEKCTFCLQRIRDARYRAKDRGVPLKDGDVVPACVQTCPTGALVFGDLNDPESLAGRLFRQQRAFRALDELNVVPSIGYLTLVKNREKNTSDESEQHG